MAEQTFNAVERVDEYCHLPEEAAYELDQSAAATKKAASGANRSNGNSGGAGGGAALAPGAGRKQRSKPDAGGLKEPLLPVVNGDTVNAGSSNSSSAGPLAVVSAGVPEGWPRAGSIEFSNVKSR